jgi:hypothetical protein
MLHRLKCRIVEGDTDGWDVYFEGSPVRHVETATRALVAATDEAAAFPFSSIMTIEWEPRTPIGRVVVKVVTE